MGGCCSFEQAESDAETERTELVVSGIFRNMLAAT